MSISKPGDELLNVPENNASLQLSKTFTAFGKELSVGGGANYVDKRLGQRGSNFYLPAYTLVNAFASYEVNEQVQLKLHVHNLFDRKHFTNSYTQIWVQPGEPRSVDLTLTYQL